jgi:hypothetical protein
MVLGTSPRADRIVDIRATEKLIPVLVQKAIENELEEVTVSRNVLN